MEKITIKEVSHRYGITQDALRYYERAGMIPPVARTAGGIRELLVDVAKEFEKK